jgi:hypothetical protein
VSVRLVQDQDGVLEISWTWLPFWLAVNPKLKEQVEREMRDGCLMGGVTNSEEDMDALHDFVVMRLQELFPSYGGLSEYLDGLKYVQEATL